MTRLIETVAMGENTALLLPDDVLERLDVAVGGNLYVSVTPDSILLSATDQDDGRVATVL